jgi:hypothetical protein
MPSLAEDFIIGMPSILSKWLDLFIAMMVEGRLLSEPPFELSQMADLIEPWENAPEDAPEDDEIPIPCSFRSVLPLHGDVSRRSAARVLLSVLTLM